MDMLKTGWNFFQNEVLGMAWLNRLIGNLINACGLDATSKIGGSIQFFVYDTIKIMVLLGVLILIISYIQSYFPPERTKKILGRFHGIGANIISALLGTVTPFCSCSSIPLFIGFTSAGLPLGVTFSFLISSPMVDLGSLVLLMSIFGWKIAVAYVVLGLVIAVAGGTLIEKLHLESYVEDFIRGGNSLDVPQEELHFKDRIKYAWEQVLATAKKVAPYVLIGVGIGAFILKSRIKAINFMSALFGAFFKFLQQSRCRSVPVCASADDYNVHCLYSSWLLPFLFFCPIFFAIPSRITAAAATAPVITILRCHGSGAIAYQPGRAL